MSRTTKSDDVRWKYLASGITILIMGTFCALLIGASVGVITLSAITQPWYLLLATAVSTALVWVYGEECYQVFTRND
jgi:uncharacterized membrane protein YccC